jgi:NAD-dependent deacetylase
MTFEVEVERAAALIRGARHMVAFTGAGQSTASGIPDFRSPGEGLWEKDDPMMVASIWAFRLDPKSFYRWIRPMVSMLLTAAPNPAHVALADLEEMGILKAVITQNIDNLHQRAGSRRVLELHGHLREATCIRCYSQVPIDPAMVQLVLSGRTPTCDCGGVYKPNVILFGEQLPVRVLNLAIDEARRCDLMLVAGSSLEVAPAADVPFLAVQCGAQAVIVNLQPTALDSQAQVVIHGDVAEILPAIVQRLQVSGAAVVGAPETPQV